jgi:hypothetical protein
MQQNLPETEAKRPNLEFFFPSASGENFINNSWFRWKQSSCYITIPWFNGVRICLDRWGLQASLKVPNTIKLKRVTSLSLEQFVTRSMANGFRHNNRGHRHRYQYTNVSRFPLHSSESEKLYPSLSRCPLVNYYSNPAFIWNPQRLSNKMRVISLRLFASYP